MEGTQSQSQPQSQSQSILQSQSQPQSASSSQVQLPWAPAPGGEITIDRNKSEVLLRNIIRSALSTLCWARHLFPDECFEDRELAGIGVKKFRSDLFRVSSECARLRFWVEEGLFDALRRNYVDTATLSIVALGTQGTPEPDCVLESYTIKVEGTPESDTSVPQSGLYTAIRDNTAQLLRNITVLTRTLNHVSACRQVEMRIRYTVDAPKEYQPKFFIGVAAGKQQVFARTPLRVRLGSVRTQFHRVQIALSSVFDVFDEHSHINIWNSRALMSDPDLTVVYPFATEQPAPESECTKADPALSTASEPQPKRKKTELDMDTEPFEPTLQFMTLEDWQSGLEVLSSHDKESITQKTLSQTVGLNRNQDAVAELMRNLFKSNCLFFALGRNLIDRERVRQLLVRYGIEPPPVGRELLDRLFMSYHVNKDRLYRSTSDDGTSTTSSRSQALRESTVIEPIEQTTVAGFNSQSSEGDSSLLYQSQSQHTLLTEKCSQVCC